MRDTIISMIKAVVDKFVSLCISDEQPCSEWDINELNQILLPVVPLKKIKLTEEELSKRIKKDELSFDAELSVKSYGFTDKVRGEMPLRVLAIAFICAGVVPQQPPAILISPFSAIAFT